MKLDSPREKPPDLSGRRNNNNSLLKERLQSNKLDSKEPSVKRRPELPLKPNARREKLKLRPSESRERKKWRREELPLRKPDKRPSLKLRLIERLEKPELLNSLLRPRPDARLRRRDKLLPEPNGRPRSRLPDLRLRKEL